jgi:hydroxymethylglutaryl-CoA synthase
VRGLISVGGYVPHHRLQRTDIRGVLGKGGGKGTRSVASYDEDTTTMGVAAGRNALRGVDAEPTGLWFATSAPAYLDKTNATAIHAALRLDASVLAMDAGGAVRSGVGALRSALEGTGTVLVVAADQRSGRPSSVEEASGGDGAAAALVGEGDLVAEYLGGASVTDEFVERWRRPGDRHTRSWEDRFGEAVYPDLGRQAWDAALKAASLEAEDVDRVAVVGLNARATGRVAKALGVEDVVDDLGATVGNTGTAHAGLLLASMVEGAEPGQVLALVSLVDGADVLLFRATDRVGQQEARTVAQQVEAAKDLPYATFLAWRGELELEPPNRPEPGRASSSVAHRSTDWKFGFVGSRDQQSGALHLPPARVSFANQVQDEMDPAPMADVLATVATFTVDRMAYSPSPPIVFAILDFDGGGRFPCELTDTEADAVRIGDRVEMTFRKLGTTDGIHNYFWKAKLLPRAQED